MGHQSYQHQPSPLIPLLMALYPLRSGLGKNREIPKFTGEIKNLKIQKAHLKRYQELTFGTSAETLPSLYPHVLAGTAHLSTLTQRHFPFSLLGAVHTANHIEHLKPLPVGLNYSLEWETGKTRFFQKAIEFDLHTRLIHGDEIYWQETSIYRVLKKNKIENDAICPVQLESLSDFQAVDSWKLNPSLGRKYAMICKDFNPIHISSLMAKTFGHRKDLAHGMAVWGQAVSKLTSSLGPLPRSLKVVFKGPCYLGSKVTLVRGTADSSRFDLLTEGNDRPVVCFEVK